MRAVPAAVALLTLAACGNVLQISHTETACIHPGDTASVTVTAPSGTDLSFQVQDDFGGNLSPSIPQTHVGADGKATVTWQSPASLSTTTLHFLLTAKSGGARTNRDIHVAVGGNGRSC